MVDWKDDKDLGPWAFQEQKNKWGYLNNPRWLDTPRPFASGGPDDYDGRESEEPQIWTPHRQPPYSSGNATKHHQCGHWHKPTTTSVPVSPPEVYLEMLSSGMAVPDHDGITPWETRV